MTPGPVCACGHLQALHLGPTGNCRVRIYGIGAGGYEASVKCPCEAFVLEDQFSKRADLA